MADDSRTGEHKPGAPCQNTNALRHGRFSVLGAAPKGAGYIKRMVGQARRQLEAACVAAHGEIDITNAALINSACRAERHALLCGRWLKLEVDASPETRLALSREIVAASEKRDKAIRSLNLETKKRNPWDEAFLRPAVALPVPQDDPEAV